MTLEHVPTRRQGTDAAPASPPTLRVIEVVELLAHHPDGFTLAAICQNLAISRATAHAILATLSAGEWVVRTAGTYRIGPALPALIAPRDGLERSFHRPLRELSQRLEMPVFLSEKRGAALVVVSATSADPARPVVIDAGLTLPFVVPFGREFVAWETPAALRDWLEPAGSIEPVLADRVTRALAEVRARGYVVERLGREYIRVYAAMRALGGDAPHDGISTRLAGAFAEMTTIDFTADELADGETFSVATISAPIRDADGHLRLAVAAQPLGPLSADRIQAIGTRLCAFAAAVTDLVPAGETGETR